MKFLIVQLPPFSRHLIPLRSKYSSQNPVLKHPQTPSLSVRDQVSHPYKTTGRIMVLYILTFTFLDSRRDDKGLWTEWQQAYLHYETQICNSTTQATSQKRTACCVNGRRIESCSESEFILFHSVVMLFRSIQRTSVFFYIFRRLVAIRDPAISGSRAVPTS
jgi:hypothetical protein